MLSLTCPPGTTILLGQFHEVTPIEVASDREDHIIRSIVPPPVLAHLLNLHIANALACAEHEMAQWVIPEVCLHHAPSRQTTWLILGAGNLVDNDLFLHRELALVQSRSHHVAEESQRPVHVLADDPCEIDGRFD